LQPKPDLCLPDHLTKIIEADYPRSNAPESKRLGELVVVTADIAAVNVKAPFALNEYAVPER